MLKRIHALSPLSSPVWDAIFIPSHKATQPTSAFETLLYDIGYSFVLVNRCSRVTLDLCWRSTCTFVVNVKGKRGHNVIISGLESEKVDIHLEKGSCHLHGVKSGTVNIQCDDGSITCKQPLLGNITMQCRGNGSIEGDRFQGTTVDCCTAQGHIKVGMLYAEHSRFISHTGDLQLGGCHGRMTAKSEGGNLTVDSLDGSLSVELGTGSADVCVARQEGVGIGTMEGDVILRFPPDYSCSLDLGTSRIEKDESLSVNLDAEGRGFLKSETDAKVKVAAPSGKISLKSQDWLASLKLQFTSSSPDRLQDFK